MAIIGPAYVCEIARPEDLMGSVQQGSSEVLPDLGTTVSHREWFGSRAPVEKMRTDACRTLSGYW
jgi:hypothetical protein